MDDFNFLEPFHQFYDKQSIISIDDERIVQFADSFLKDHIDKYTETTNAIALPLNFPDISHEINFLSASIILTVGSNYEVRAKEANQSNLQDVIFFGIIGTYLTKGNIDAALMQSLRVSDLGELFSLPLFERNKALEQSYNLPIATIETKGGLYDYAELLVNTLHACGAGLSQRGFPDISSYLLHLLSSHHSTEDVVRAVSQLCPQLDDREVVSVTSMASGEQQVVELPFLRNARRLVYEVIRCVRRCHRDAVYGADNAAVAAAMGGLCAVAPDDMLAAPSLRCLSSLLRLGLLHAHSDTESPSSSSPADDIEGDRASSEGDQGIAVNIAGVAGALSVRAAALIACHRLADTIATALSPHPPGTMTVTPMGLGVYLEWLGRDLPLEYCPDTLCARW